MVATTQIRVFIGMDVLFRAERQEGEGENANALVLVGVGWFKIVLHAVGKADIIAN